jgi:hypothetical protein
MHALDDIAGYPAITALDAIRAELLRQLDSNIETPQGGARIDKRLAQCWGCWVNWPNWNNWNTWSNWRNWGNYWRNF